jgi:Bacterial tandem repeat domain 1
MNQTSTIKCYAHVLACIGVLSALGGGRPAWAQPHPLLQYHGGPVLETFRIYPLYYGNWSAADINAQQTFLVNLAGYLCGQNAPAFEQPMMKQYGVNQATVAPVATASPTAAPAILKSSDILNIIHANQAAGNLPAFGSDTLIMVFPAHGFGLDVCNGCGYHSSESPSAFWAVVPHDVGPTLQLVTAHEVFEAAADPAIGNSPGWDEPVDGCTSISFVTLSFGQIPGAADNTNAGTCSTTGYTSLAELQVYGWTYADYRARYDQLWPQGWRLYSLQSYVLPDGQVRYNAVWRPAGNIGEIQVYGYQYSDYRSVYDQLWPQGWRLYILDTFVLPDGETRYNAVWRPGNSAEIQDYGVTYEQYRSDYDRLWPQGWRIYILQAYVLPGGQVLYNAVWRPGNCGEIQVYGWTYADYRANYDQLWQQGWRLYILQSYVLPDGEVRYNAVWRPGNHGEIQVYDYQYADYRSTYDQLWQQGWRLYILQSYVLPDGEVRYNAVWRQGTLDRPL